MILFLGANASEISQHRFKNYDGDSVESVLYSTVR